MDLLSLWTVDIFHHIAWIGQRAKKCPRHLPTISLGFPKPVVLSTKLSHCERWFLWNFSSSGGFECVVCLRKVKFPIWFRGSSVVFMEKKYWKLHCCTVEGTGGWKIVQIRSRTGHQMFAVGHQLDSRWRWLSSLKKTYSWHIDTEWQSMKRMISLLILWQTSDVSTSICWQMS